MKKIVIAIDGYSACGKSSTAKVLAQHLGYTYIDTGAMYRAVTLYFLDHNVTLTNPKEVSRALEAIDVAFHYVEKSDRQEVFLNGLNVEDQVRLPRVSDQVSPVSAIKAVREAMVAQQRKMGRKKGVVMDGRDIGTVVFPDAELKIFMTADINIRAERRQIELLEKGQMVTMDQVKDNLQKRDQMDTTREESPLRQADDAYVVDTSQLIFDEQVEEILNLVTSKIVEHTQLADDV